MIHQLEESDNLFFFGQDWRSALVLDQLISSGLKPETVVTLPDKPQGRKQLILANSVRKLADKNNIKIVEFVDLISGKQFLKKANAAVLASFGAIIPRQIINLFPKGILTLHPSLLPKYRGPSPVFTALLNGDKNTGLTIIQMDEKVDHGPIIAQFNEVVLPKDTTQSLEKRLFSLGAKVLLTVLPAYLQGQITPKPQNHQQASYTTKLTKENNQIDWSKTPQKIECLIRAAQPWPVAFTKVRTKPNQPEKILKIHQAHLDNNKLVLDKVQLESKKPVSWIQFEQGYPEAKISKN